MTQLKGGTNGFLYFGTRDSITCLKEENNSMSNSHLLESGIIIDNRKYNSS